MKLIRLRFVAVSSLLSLAIASGATRPHYGGAIHVQMQEAPVSIDPATLAGGRSAALLNLSALLFENLTVVDAQGRPQSALSESWEAEPGDQRWRFHLRRGVTFDDGAPLTSEAVASSLRAANSVWKIFASGEAVVVECSSACSDLPATLALGRYAISRRVAGKTSGTGAFTVSEWDPGKKLALAAREGYWSGRPFADSVVVEMGRSFRDQSIAQDLGKADVIEVAPEQIQRALQEGRKLSVSQPSELMALVFARESKNPEEKRLRDALALSLDRNQFNDVLLLRGGEPAASLLPNWMTGYGFVFSTARDLAQARQICSEVKQGSIWTISYPPNDALARVIVDRIVLDAHAAGLSLQSTDAASSDLRLLRIPLPSKNAAVALVEMAAATGVAAPQLTGDSAADLYLSEHALLQTKLVIPLLHLRTAFDIAPAVAGWRDGAEGLRQLPDLWISAAGK